MKCPNCGLENPDNYAFCGRCGAIVQQNRVIDRARIEQEKKRMADLIKRRRSTDRMISPWWALVIVAVQIISIIADIAASISSAFYGQSLSVTISQLIFYGGTISAVLMGVYVIYCLIDRQNKHFAREWRLRSSILDMIKSMAGSAEAEAILMRDIGPMLDSHRPAETHRSPMLWSFIAGIPAIVTAFFGILTFAGAAWTITIVMAISVLMALLVAIICVIFTIYIFHFLTKDMQEHDQRWWQFSTAATNAFTKFGIKSDYSVQPHPLPVREAWIYVILCIIPFFFFFWFYSIIADGNEHFKHQRAFEKWLYESVGKLKY